MSQYVPRQLTFDPPLVFDARLVSLENFLGSGNPPSEKITLKSILKELGTTKG